MGNKHIRSSIYYTCEQAKRLERLAANFGYFQSRGVGAGKVGSISKLIQAIADGELVVVPLKESA